MGAGTEAEVRGGAEGGAEAEVRGGAEGGAEVEVRDGAAGGLLARPARVWIGVILRMRGVMRRMANGVDARERALGEGERKGALKRDGAEVGGLGGVGRCAVGKGRAGMRARSRRTGRRARENTRSR